MTTSGFNVLGEMPWMPMVMPDGQLEYATPVTVLSDPSRYTSLQFPSPMHTAAVWRWLIVLAARAADNGGIEAYAERWWDRFWLRDSERPFAQRIELVETLAGTEDMSSSLVRLDSRRAKGNNSVLWDWTMADDEVTAQAYEVVPLLIWTMAAAVGGNVGVATYGGQRGKPSAPPNAPVKDLAVAIAHGQSLADGLAAAMGAFPQVPGDRPLWERDDDFTVSKIERTPAGPMEWLTWPSRNNLLDWSGDTVTGAVSTPCWAPPNGLDRLALDPTLVATVAKPGSIATPGPDDKRKPLHAQSIRKWARAVHGGDETVRRPEQFVSIEGPIAVDVIAQSTDSAKYREVARQTVYFAAEQPEGDTDETDQ